MTFAGRSQELGAIRGLLDQRHPVLLRITGLPGVGKSSLVRRAVTDFEGLVCTCPPLPAPDQRFAVASRIERTGHPPGADADWPEIFAAILNAARSASRPWVLVLDDAHRLSEARARFLPSLIATLHTAAGDGVPLHVVLVGRHAGLPDEQEFPADFTVSTKRIPPLPLRAAANFLPGATAHARVRAYGVFGGIPRILSALDSSVTVGTNVRRLVLHGDGVLADAPLAWLEREVQKPTRYLAILRTLAYGAADWATVHTGVPDLTRSGQVAPYINRLAELGMVESATSLDAGTRSRSTRYSLTDPFLAFWLRFALPWRLDERRYDERRDDQRSALREHYTRTVRPAVASHLESLMPGLARQHMRNDAIETLGGTARECGSLWGSSYEIPVAGILTSGAAFYGACSWKTPTRDADLLAALDADVRETRYGFGRERRLRLVFTGRAAPTWLRREVARRPDAELIDAGALLGE
jgi:hypothetical protein